ncbi:biliverdin-producing heme oxygenase [Gluconobacter sp. LMG 31484]|uniref:Biliverdin-producing heme oxygenase n=1 Tax=Gluconobacter vitians TaxID=2728102 RepID=A0ABR9Y4I7_9PROT|nr:biliverdin-producing heme oxygenase [Gluconobacter vitians]MBF0858374.1 biliverdin-producing heme oxygenase [Gluconobacter vitians]
METAGRADERKNSGLEELRRVSRKAHDAVDEAFSRFELTDRKSYGAFLTAHARALVVAEAYLGRYSASVPPWRPRAELLKKDLCDMGLPMPASQRHMLSDCSGTAFGVLYVLEGSRLGGRILSGRVGEGLPRAYLSAVHQKGEWSAFLERLAQFLDESPVARRQAVTDGAVAAFALFRDSARFQFSD